MLLSECKFSESFPFTTVGPNRISVILILRTYAIWNGKRSISICLVIVALVRFSSALQEARKLIHVEVHAFGSRCSPRRRDGSSEVYDRSHHGISITLITHSDGPAEESRFSCNMIKTNDITFIYYLTVLASETSTFTSLFHLSI